MNYEKIYNDIIERAKNRTLTEGVYYEVHHITPKSLKGLDIPENKVALTYREHIMAHHLLMKMYPDNRKMFKAIYYMIFKKLPDEDQTEIDIKIDTRKLEREKMALLKIKYPNYMSTHRSKVEYKLNYIKGPKRKTALERYLETLEPGFIKK